jgi:hypothetical protein
MRRVRAIVLFCLLLAPVAAYGQMKIIPKARLDSVARPPLADNAKSLCFDRIAWDAGVMNESDAPKDFAFGFVNKGTKDLLVRKMVTTCSCVQAQCDKSVVKAGERAVITLKYTPAGHVGGFVRRVFVYTDDHDQASAVLSLSVRVVSEQKE